MKTFPLLHAFLFTLALLAYLYLISDVIASPDQIVRPLLLLWAMLVLLSWPAYWISRDWDWAGLLLTVFVLGICSSSRFSLAAVAISVAVLLPWCGYSILRRRGVKIEQVSILLNLTSLILAGILLFPSVTRLLDLPASYRAAVRTNGRPLLAVPTAHGALPDIYYVVLDGYGRADALQEYFHFDNSGIVKFLQSRGFVVPAESRSNYPKTALSVTSTLNMNYIQDLTSDLQDSYYWWLMSPLIDHSQTRAMLEQLGYQTISITTDWSITDNPTTDVYYQPTPIVLSDLESVLVAKTPLGRALNPALSKFAIGRSFASHRQVVLYNFEALAQISSMPGPKFVFAHIISPHPPFVFDKDGAPIDPGYGFTFNDANDFPLSKEEFQQGYIGQVQFVNMHLEQVVDSLLQNSSTPPIIILLADHGSGLLTDFGSSENTCLKERFSSFAAFHLPGLKPDAIPSDITPVNLFRIIFNEYFSTGLPLLENRYFFYKDFVYIYRAEDVSARVNTCSVH